MCVALAAMCKGSGGGGGEGGQLSAGFLSSALILL